jgi:hypothetical protein
VIIEPSDEIAGAKSDALSIDGMAGFVAIPPAPYKIVVLVFPLESNVPLPLTSRSTRVRLAPPAVVRSSFWLPMSTNRPFDDIEVRTFLAGYEPS